MNKGRPLWAELSPVTDFREACCRQNETNECNRGGFCNFMHLKYPSDGLVKQLHHEQAVEIRAKKRAREEARRAEAEAAGGDDEGRGRRRSDAASGADGDAKPSWKSGPSGGDWRSGQQAQAV